MKLRKTGLWLLVTLVIAVLCTVGFASSEVTAVLPEEEKCTGFVSDYTDEEAAAAFIARTMTGDGVKRRGAYVGDSLTGQEKKLYDLLKAKIQLVASGGLESTEFDFPAEEFFTKTRYTAEELGVASISDENFESVKSEFAKKFVLDVDSSKIMRALLVDCSYDLYWFDKTEGFSISGVGYSLSANSMEMWIAEFKSDIEVKMSVSADYAGTAGSYSVNPVYGQSATAAAANARQIVSDNRNKGDVAKLEAYRDEICSRVSYNYSAAAGGVAYGDPWQMVWVFDNNTDTNVVCEGYSKAFQFLCDESTFIGNVRSIIVSGTMGGGTGEGPHMWNVVRLNNGNNYLVDITNSDSGSVGQDGGLFLAGYSDTGTESDGSTKYFYQVGNQSIWYVYNEDTIALYAAEDLSVANQSYQGGTESDTWGYEYEEGEQMLRITGTGAVEVNGAAPWLGQNYVIKRVMVESGITSIGPNVFAGLDGRVRIDFCQDVIPAIDPDAFGGTKAVCRYTSDNGSWESEHPEIDGVSWVWMPTFNTMAAGTFGSLWYERDEDYDGWSVEVNAEGRTYADMPAETAHEILLYCYDLFLNDIPDPEELETVIGDMEDEYWYLVLTYKCEGTLKLNGEGGISVRQMPREINISSPDLVMEVTDPREEGIIHKLEVQSGTITYNGNVEQLILTNSGGEKGTATVNGTIGELDFYNGSGDEDRPFYGTLTVSGTIRKGMVYGDSTLTMKVPGVSDNYPLGSDFAGQTFGELTGLDNTTVIDTDRNPAIAADLSAADAPTVDQFIPRYVFSGTNNWLDLRPREGSGLGSKAIEININEYKPNFRDNLTDNIIWGDDTEIHLSISENGEPIVLAGKDEIGFGELSASGGCNVKVTCPLGRIQLQPDPQDFGTIKMVFENMVGSAYLQPNNCKLNITLQNGGSIAEGRWKQLLRDYRNFGTHGTAAGGSMELVDNSTLTVMSWTYSELFSSIMPSDEAVGQAAGVGHAMATLTESGLSLAEASALQNVVGGEGESLSVAESQIISVFDVSVKEYTVDGEGNAEFGADIHELSTSIPITVSNSSGEADVFVVRLHEDGGNIEATKLEVTENNGGIQFESDLFSTYLLVSGNRIDLKISGESLAKFGEDYPFTVSNLSHGGRCLVEVYDRMIREIDGVQVQVQAYTETRDLTGDDSMDFTIPAENLENRHRYYIKAYILGDDDIAVANAWFDFYVYNPSTKPKITLSTDTNTVKTAARVEIHVKAPAGTTAIRFWDGTNWNHVSSPIDPKTGEATYVCFYDDPGTVTLIAEATKYQEDIWNVPESEWIYTSKPLTLTITQKNEEIDGLSVTPEVLSEVLKGDMLELTVTAGNSVDFDKIGGNAIAVDIKDSVRSTNYYYSSLYRNEKFPFTFEVPTFALPVTDDPVEYQVVVRVCGVGYRWTEFRIPFTLKDAVAIRFFRNDWYGNPKSQSAGKGVPTLLRKHEDLFSRKGWHFLGWTTDPEKNEPDYLDEQEVCITEDLTLHGLWEKNPNSFILDVVDLTDPDAPVSGRGGTIHGYDTLNANENDSETVEFDCTKMTDYPEFGYRKIRLETQADSGYSFVGWYTGEMPDEGSQTLVPGKLLGEYSWYYVFELSEDRECKKICAVFDRSEGFGKAAFTVPSSLKMIEANAFEGIGAKSVYVPNTCTDIGEGAFGNCANLLKVRLPKNCAIHDEAFAGSDRVVIYAQPGGTTQMWAEKHGLFFRPE